MTTNIFRDHKKIMKLISWKYTQLVPKVKTLAPESKHIINAVPRCLSRRPEGSECNIRAEQLKHFLQPKCQSDDNFIFIDPNPELSDFYYKWDGLKFNRRGIEYFSKCSTGYESHCENFLIPNNQLNL